MIKSYGLRINRAIRVFLNLFASGPMKVVFLNNLESIMEALVTKKADFASRNLLKSSKCHFKPITNTYYTVT